MFPILNFTIVSLVEAPAYKDEEELISFADKLW